jgi:hypothetical protein
VVIEDLPENVLSRDKHPPPQFLSVKIPFCFSSGSITWPGMLNISWFDQKENFIFNY